MYKFILHLYNYPYSNLVGIVIAYAVAMYGVYKLIVDYFKHNVILTEQIFIFVVFLGLLILVLSNLFVVIMKILAFKNILDNNYQYKKFIAIHRYDPIVKYLVKIKENEK